MIGYKSRPGGGTTDYAVDIFYQALEKGQYECFLAKNTYLPMMYMEDAVKATVGVMETDPANITVRSSYNVTALSFSPEEIAHAIRQHLHKFEIAYNPDFRQQIADSWPCSIDDSQARTDWGWSPDYDLEKMTSTILEGLSELINP